jgi:hypothetical protein
MDSIVLKPYVKPSPEVIAKFVERFQPPAAYHGRYLQTPERVAESLIQWIMCRPPAYAQEILWSRVMQDRLYFEMGEIYLKPFYGKKLTDRRYELVGKQFTKDMLGWMTAEMGWEAPD